MEAISLTGFKTRSTITLIIIISILLISFRIQLKLIDEQQQNAIIINLAAKQSALVQSVSHHINALQRTMGADEEAMKIALVAYISRLNENHQYIKSSEFLPDDAKRLLLQDQLDPMLTQFIDTSHHFLQTPDIANITTFNWQNTKAIMDKSDALVTSLETAFTNRIANQKQTVQQLLVFSLTVITLGILFVVVPVLRRVRNDKKAIEKQRQQIARIRNTFDVFTDHSQNGIVNFERASGNINFVNQSCLAMLDYATPADITQQHISILFDEPVDKILDSSSTQIKNATDTAIPVVLDSFTSARIEDGAEIIWLNITDLRPIIEMENRSQNAQKMESMGTLASGIAHDFNNILAIIRGSSDLLKMSGCLEGKSKDCLHHIIDAGERGAAMVRQILQFSRADTQFLKVIDIVDNIQQTIAILTPGLKKKCEVHFKPDANGNILADESSISQILINLVKNASQAGATVVDLFLTQESNEFLLTVQDNGAGISPDVVDNIFEPFFSTKQKTEGTGLGLSVVHGIVKKLNGTITVSSSLKQGTRFHIRLPQTHLGLEVPENASHWLQSSSDKQVLLVEDEDNLRYIYTTFLGMRGFKVTEASNGEEALAIFQQSKDQFDILLTDQNMPGLLGTEVILAIRHLSTKKMRIVMITGDIEDAARELKNQGIIHEILTKPVALPALEKAFE